MVRAIRKKISMILLPLVFVGMTILTAAIPSTVTAQNGLPADGAGAGLGLPPQADQDISEAATEPPNDAFFDTTDPLVQFGTAGELRTPGDFVSRFLGVFAFPLAGFLLFVMIFWGGFEMFSTSTTKKSLQAGRQRVMAALVGFMLLFASYWAIQIIEIIFGIRVL